MGEEHLERGRGRVRGSVSGWERKITARRRMWNGKSDGGKARRRGKWSGARQGGCECGGEEGMGSRKASVTGRGFEKGEKETDGS